MKVIQKVLNQENREFAFLAYKELKNGKINKIEIINDKYDYEKFVDKIVDVSDVDSREELENSDAKYFDEKLFNINLISKGGWRKHNDILKNPQVYKSR